MLNRVVFRSGTGRRGGDGMLDGDGRLDGDAKRGGGARRGISGSLSGGRPDGKVLLDFCKTYCYPQQSVYLYTL